MKKARLQTFPDTFVFMGNKTSVKDQIGMTVPSEGSKIIFKTALKCFSLIDYPATPTSIK